MYEPQQQPYAFHTWSVPQKLFGSSARKPPPTFADVANSHTFSHANSHPSVAVTPPSYHNAYTNVDYGPRALPHRLTPDRKLQVWDPYAATWRYVTGHGSKKVSP